MVQKNEFWSIWDLQKQNKQPVTIERKKTFNKKISDARQKAKEAFCFHCKEEVASFCNSHSIPSFCLKTIAKEGKLLMTNAFMNVQILDKEKGVKQTGTFQLICKACDNTVFSEYETPINYELKPTQQMLTQIALKNFLQHISRKKQEIALFESLSTEDTRDDPYIYNNLETKQFDLKIYTDKYNKAKQNLLNDHEVYKCLYFQTLPYICPVAFQDNVTICLDLHDKIINNIYTPTHLNDTTSIHISIFPLKTSTAILIFLHRSEFSEYKTFFKTFWKKNLEEQLEILNFIIFAYSENVYMSPLLPAEVLENQELIDIVRPVAPTFFPNKKQIQQDFKIALKETFSFSNMKRIPNLLSEKYKLKNFKEMG